MANGFRIGVNGPGRSGATATSIGGYEVSLRLPLGVRCGGAGLVYRASASPSTAGVVLHCRELTKGARRRHHGPLSRPASA
jgi:hypothetical protein